MTLLARSVLLGLVLVIVVPYAAHAMTPQQQRMADCNAQASNIAGTERQKFMKACLRAPKKLYCSQGKLCGGTCIAANETCHQ